MSVLIKGLAMPQSCYDCDMLELSGVVGCKHAYDTKNSEWGRALDCPLIELPGHGDLVDIDAILGDFAELRDYDFASREYVVIPAERSEDETN